MPHLRHRDKKCKGRPSNPLPPPLPFYPPEDRAECLKKPPRRTMTDSPGREHNQATYSIRASSQQTCITRNGDLVSEDFFQPERPEDANSFDYEGPTSVTSYHETTCHDSRWLSRRTLSRGSLEIIEHHYPAIQEHLPLRLLLQYLLFGRHAVNLNSTWEGELAPLPAPMLAWMAGRQEQYENRNFRAENMLWWAKDELFGDDFKWCDWRWSPNPDKRRYRRILELNLVGPVVKAVNTEMQRPVSELESRVWFATGKAYTKQAAADLRSNTKEMVSNMNATVLDAKGHPDVPGTIQQYLNGLPVDSFNRVVDEYAGEAYEAADEHFGEESGDSQSRSERHARTVLRHVEDCPQPLYKVKQNTQRLYAKNSLQNLNREIRKVLTQDWTTLDLKSAHLAICARLWEIDPLMDFLENGGDIWEELVPYMEMEKPPIKNALYALVYGATVYWTNHGEHPAMVTQTFMKEAGLSWEEAKEARTQFLNHPLINALYNARNERIEEIEEAGFLKDVFGVELELSAEDNVSPLTLLTAESAAVEMMLLWPAFEKVIDKEKRCKIMLYTFDGIYIKVANPKREGTWVRKLQTAVDQRAEELDIPTYLEHED